MLQGQLLSVRLAQVCSGICPRACRAPLLLQCTAAAGRQTSRQAASKNRVTDSPRCSDRTGSEFGAPANLGGGGLFASDPAVSCPACTCPLSHCGLSLAPSRLNTALCQPVWCPFPVFSWYVCGWLRALRFVPVVCVLVDLFLRVCGSFLAEACFSVPVWQGLSAPATHAVRTYRWLLDFGRLVAGEGRVSLYVCPCVQLFVCVRACVCVCVLHCIFPP